MVGVEAGGTGAILSQKTRWNDRRQDADLAAYIAKELGLKVEFEPTACLASSLHSSRVAST